jgi:hypothetical protein
LTCENVSILRIEPEESMVPKVRVTALDAQDRNDWAPKTAASAASWMKQAAFIT